MAQYKTPGVYVVEENAFPNAVVEVPTAVPAFIGYTETAHDGTESRQYVPTQIGSLADYAKIFGGPSKAAFTLAQSVDKTQYIVAQDPASRFFLGYAVYLYFANGGGSAYVISIGSYADAILNGKSAADFMPAPNPVNPAIVSPFDALKTVPDVTLLVAPDTVLLDRAPSCYGFWTAALAHCGTMQSRMALIDIFNGDQSRTHASDTDVISGANTGFRNLIGTDFLNYGAAYYPWLNCDVVDSGKVTYANLNSDSLAVLRQALNDELATLNPPPGAPQLTKIRELYAALSLQVNDASGKPLTDSDGNPLPDDKGDADDTQTNAINAAAAVTRIHNQLSSVSLVYQRICADMLKRANVLPPCGAIAGVYARVDSNQGVFAAPANTDINLAVTPAVEISAEDQEDLNVPQDGRAVNAIRTIPNRGLVIWGARTLDGNSDDWRYINVRRTVIMLEQSIKLALMAYVFAPNESTTWVAVENMISNFLLNQWRAGALIGSKPQDAYSVSVGLGTTMTAQDILDGYMRVSIKVAISHPAEFMELTFEQQMQTS